jgi:hypothetical protein
MTRSYCLEHAKRFADSGSPALCLPFFVALFFYGCAGRRTPAIPWATAIQVRPVLVRQAPVAAPEPPDIALDFENQILSMPTQLEVARPEPERPYVPPSAAELERIRKDNEPLLAPQMTTQQLAFVEQQTNESLAVAMHNLKLVRGHPLNAMQTDIASKVGAFIAQARAAAQEQDWIRASNLAKKAKVLSAELVNSL